MKCIIPEISWHNRDPVLCLDIQPKSLINNEEFYRLASGGTDSHILIWHMRIESNGAANVEPVCDLTRHQRAVNVVKWSPCGLYLASGDDDANIIIWHQKVDELAAMLNEDNDTDKEKWNMYKVLRGHKEDVYDLSWSPDSLKLVSGSVDNTAIIWSLSKGNIDHILSYHKGFVQGVSWCPSGTTKYIATLSSDRTCRVFTENGRQVRARLAKGLLPFPEGHSLHGQVVRYYHDDTLKSFFRRLSFSPDGNLIVTPAGCLETGTNGKKLYTSYIYTTCSLTQPVAILPSPNQYTVVARFCPVLFQLWPDGPEPTITLPYRMIIAIASRTSVTLYDTQQLTPFAIISNIHYTRLTDVAWSSDGRVLAVSSTDGFCSLVTFEMNELGVEYVPPQIEDSVVEANKSEIIEEKDLCSDKPVEEEIKRDKKPNFLQQWASKKKLIQHNKNNEDVIMVDVEKENQINTSKTVKPIEVRRKPRTTGQMNLEEYIKPTQQMKLPPPVISECVLEDSAARDAWPEQRLEETIDLTEDECSQTDSIVNNSQDLKLFVEDSTPEDKSDEQPAKVEQCMEVDDVSNKLLATHQKKRVPFITLSSPKHKKQK